MAHDADLEGRIREAIRAHAVFSASRAGGPGGQHVNTSATRVELRMPIADLPLTPVEQDRLRAALGGRITSDDAIRVAIATERSQLMNRRRAEEVLLALVLRHRRAPRDRRATRPTAASRVRRREQKARRSEVKRSRGRPADPD